jgi:hypothetical protein
MQCLHRPADASHSGNDTGADRRWGSQMDRGRPVPTMQLVTAQRQAAVRFCATEEGPQ